MFPTIYTDILAKVNQIDPVKYAHTRNYIDGAVTKLSPYISRGVISTKQVMEQTIARGYASGQIWKFLQELAWRDYWQMKWRILGESINEDIRHPQTDVANHKLPEAIIKAETGIRAIDDQITEFYQLGYMHNHVRMYVASLCCNIAHSQWMMPAKWMYYHLLDGDWASNALSWQWVAGTNAGKKYFANQENINNFLHSDQTGTFLDVSYEALGADIPGQLKTTTKPALYTPLPETEIPKINIDQPVYLYNWYNLDPNWAKDENANRVLLLEPSIFEQYPISEASVQFMLALAENIPNIQIYTGAFDVLQALFPNASFHYKEHPLNHHYKGTEHPRDWMFKHMPDTPSFFGFWKKCKGQIGIG